MPVMPDEDVVELVAVRCVLEGLLDERVLDDLVLDAGLAELGAELGRLLDGHPLVVEEDGRGHLVEPALDRRRSASLFLRSRCASGSGLLVFAPTNARGSILTPGPIVELSVMLRR